MCFEILTDRQIETLLDEIKNSLSFAVEVQTINSLRAVNEDINNT